MVKKYSIILPTYDPELKKVEQTKIALESVKKYAELPHEIIIVKDVVGYSNAINEGLHRATGDYIIVASDDIEIHEPYLAKLTKENAVVSWRFVPFYMTGELVPDGSLYGFSRETYEKMGDMDTAYVGGYGCDEVDHFFSAKDNGVEFASGDIKVTHKENQTFKTYWTPEKEGMTTRNVGIFYQKWHKKYELKP